MDKRIEIYCDGEKCFVISLDSIYNTIFSITPIVKSIGFNLDDNKLVHEWYCLNISKEYLKIFIQLIRKEISIFSDFSQLPKIHYDFYGIEIIQEKILDKFLENYQLKSEKKEFIINNNIITLKEIINSITNKQNYEHRITFRKESKFYENMNILCEKFNQMYSKFSVLLDTLDSNSISNLNKVFILKDFDCINIEYTDDFKCFIFPNEIFHNILRMDMTKFNLLKNYDTFLEIDLDTLKISLLECEQFSKIIDKINHDKMEYVGLF